MSTIRLEHPDLGTFDGQQGDGVQQFLGIQYATLRNRLAEPQLKTAYEAPIDATRYGPAAHQPPSGFDNEVNLFIQQPLPKPELTYSDVECLNLNITVPSPKQGEALSGQKLPVFVWIHGGGFVLGANSWPQYDHAKLVKLASERNVPVIGVGINFRLGLPALLTSEELRSAGYKSNNLLRDQRAAFAWIRKFISGFGGDPDKITAIGESSGAMAVTLHLCSQTPLFHRAIATGGTLLLRKPLPPQVHEMIYQQATNALGVDKLSVEERIKALLTRPMDEVIATLPPSVAFNALIDGDLITSEVSYASVASSDVESIPAKEWLQALMVGDCQFDASVLLILLGHLKPHAITGFPAVVRRVLPPETADKILAMYNFPSAKTDEEAFASVINYVNDVGYYLSTLAFAEGFSHPSTSGKGSSIFFFNHKNPWPGPFQGKASHVLDVAFLFQNYNHVLSDQQRKSAEDFAIDMMRFVSGEEVLGSDDGKVQTGMAKVYGDEGVKTAHAREGTESGRNVELISVAKEVGGDKLMGVFEKFMMGG